MSSDLQSILPVFQNSVSIIPEKLEYWSLILIDPLYFLSMCSDNFSDFVLEKNHFNKNT
jgi:hypothetical protein